MTEVFLCTARRTPIGRYGGALAMVRPDDMVAHVIDGLLDLHPGLPVDEVIFGCANQAGEDNRNVARMGVLLSRLGEGVPALTVNRLCASGLDAVIAGARAVRDGADLVIAGGVESMTRAPFVTRQGRDRLCPRARDFRHDDWLALRQRPDRKSLWYRVDAGDGRERGGGMGVSRADQDAFALRSQQRYDAAWHAADILPVTVAGRKGEATWSRRTSIRARPRSKGLPPCPRHFAQAARSQRGMQQGSMMALRR